MNFNVADIHLQYIDLEELKMVRLSKWGGSTGLRLGKEIMTAAGLKPGDFVTLRLLDSGDIRVRPCKGLQAANSGAAKEAAPAKPVLEQW
jgi:antitoxin MazE